MIPVTDSLSLDETEIEERFLRASGPGGQHVNTTESAVQLRFDARRSPSLPDAVAARLLRLAGQRATRDGVIVITAQRFRSQEQNRADALERLLTLLREAAQRPKPRRPTRPTRAARERRLKSKARRSDVKSLRGKPGRE